MRPPLVAPRILLVDYAPPVQLRMASEFGELPPGSLLKTALIDYGQLRRALCAAEGWIQPACTRIRGEIAP